MNIVELDGRTTPKRVLLETYLETRDFEAFFKYVEPLMDDRGCWEWGGARNEHGYGQTAIKHYLQMKAHRLSWMIHHSIIADEVCVLHKCDNPPCVNPDHLFIGTKKDNMQDCSRKGRVRYILRRGESNECAKLTDKKVAEARRLYASGDSLRSVAQRYGVNSKTMSRAIHGLQWAHVPISAELRAELNAPRPCNQFGRISPPASPTPQPKGSPR
jgi:hypothetical protein